MELRRIVLLKFTFFIYFSRKFKLRSLVPIVSLRGAFASLLAGELRPSKQKQHLEVVFVPPAPDLRSVVRSSSSLKTKKTEINPAFFYIGGAKEDRTPDLLNAIQALSQLSYNPNDEHLFSTMFLKCKAIFSIFNRFYYHQAI